MFGSGGASGVHEMMTGRQFRPVVIGCLLGLAVNGPTMAVVDRQATASLYEEALIRYQEKDLATAEA